MKEENEEYLKVKYKPIVTAIKEVGVDLPQLKREREKVNHQMMKPQRLYIPSSHQQTPLSGVLNVFQSQCEDMNVTPSFKDENQEEEDGTKSPGNITNVGEDIEARVQPHPFPKQKCSSILRQNPFSNKRSKK